MKDAVIVSAVRTPVGNAPKGTLSATRPDDLGALVIREALARAPGLDPAEVDDAVLGCAMPEGEQGLNVARIAALRAGLPVSASAVNKEWLKNQIAFFCVQKRSSLCKNCGYRESRICTECNSGSC